MAARARFNGVAEPVSGPRAGKPWSPRPTLRIGASATTAPSHAAGTDRVTVSPEGPGMGWSE